MILAIVGIGVLAFFTERRRSDAELADLAREQFAVAQAAAPRMASGTLAVLDRPGNTRVVTADPDGNAQLLDGTPVHVAALEHAIEHGEPTARLEPDEAVALGLPRRTAMVGVARTQRGSWVAIIATAAAQRDRDVAGQQRLLASILLAAGLVGGFGGLALSRQRRHARLERELAVAQVARDKDAELERLSRAVTMAALGSGMAHELGTPIAVIVGRAEQLLARAGSDERIAKNAQAILDEANRIDQVIRGLLSLARGTPIALATVSAKELVDQAEALVEHRFAAANVSIVRELAADLPMVRCEPMLVRQVLVNLLLNACDASQKGARVVLAVEATAETVCFRVADEGHGITTTDAARATAPFFTTKRDGTGLGLSIANEIVATHRGTLNIAPRTDGGTQVEVTLPLETLHA